MEHCNVLTVWVNVVVSFDSARQILGGIVTDCRRNVYCVLIGNPELFSLVCCVVDSPPNLSWRWDGEGWSGEQWLRRAWPNREKKVCEEADSTS